MKIYIFSDMEGVAGIEQWDNSADTSPANLAIRERHQRLLTHEINAAVQGAFDGGANEVVVKMGHSDSILFEELHPRAKFIRTGITWLQGLDDTFDAYFVVGQHSKAGTPDGMLCHSWSHTDITWWRVNGVEIGEFGAAALLAGEFGVPAAFLSGDHAASREARALIPGIVTAEVKYAYGLHSACHLSKEASHALIRAKAREATKGVKRIKPWTLKAPFKFLVRSPKKNPPLPKGCRRVDPFTFAATGKTFSEVWHKLYY